MRLAVVNTKGGTGKTTTAMFTAAGLHRLGRTLLIDTDRQASALSWSEQDPGFAFTVISLPVRDVHRRLTDLGRGYDHVVIDSPPQDLGVIASAVMAAEIVLVPVAPTGLDLDRIQPTWKLLAELEPVHPVEVGVLLTRVRKGTVNAREVRGVLAQIGYPVMNTEIPLSEAIASSFGTMPDDLGAYDQLVKELMS
jgi:chromosome partitioning protein